MSKPIAVEDATFDKEVLQSKLPVLVDFWAPWCGPCRMVAPVIDELADEYEGKAAFVKVNVDESQGTARQYNIMSIPTLLFFKDGRPVANIVGFKPKEEIKERLDAAIG